MDDRADALRRAMLYDRADALLHDMTAEDWRDAWTDLHHDLSGVLMDYIAGVARIHPDMAGEAAGELRLAIRDMVVERCMSL